MEREGEEREGGRRDGEMRDRQQEVAGERGGGVCV